MLTRILFARGAPPLAALVLLVGAAGLPAAAQDAPEPMPTLAGLDAASRALAAACSASDSGACTQLADARFRAGDGAAANALYRRAADLARLGEAPRSPAALVARVRSVADAVAALEAAWDGTVVPAATRHGLGDFARDARPQVFGAGAVTAWTGRRAHTSDAYRAIHTSRTREGAVWAHLAWIGDLPSLAAPAALWELRLGWMNLDFMAYLDDEGAVVALVHFPEG